MFSVYFLLDFSQRISFSWAPFGTLQLFFWDWAIRTFHWSNKFLWVRVRLIQKAIISMPLVFASCCYNSFLVEFFLWSVRNQKLETCLILGMREITGRFMIVSNSSASPIRQSIFQHIRAILYQAFFLNSIFTSKLFPTSFPYLQQHNHSPHCWFLPQFHYRLLLTVSLLE